jgi:hypothetical protein
MKEDETLAYSNIWIHYNSPLAWAPNFVRERFVLHTTWQSALNSLLL